MSGVAGSAPVEPFLDYEPPQSDEAVAVARTRTQVRQRLTAEINYRDTRHAVLLDQAAAGRELKIRPETV